MNLSTITRLALVATAATLTSCVTTDDVENYDTAERMSRRGAADDAASEARAEEAAERLEMQKNIKSAQARARSEAAAERAREEELDTASRMMRRGAGGSGSRAAAEALEDAAEAAEESAEDADTAARMMGRGNAG